MLTPGEYDHLCDQLMHLYWDLDEEIIADMTRRLMKTGGDYLPDAAAMQAVRMQQAGLLYEDIIAEISKRSGMTQRQVARTFERAGVQCIRNDNRFYRAGGLEGIVKMSDAALQTLNAGYVKCNGDLQNLTLTTANTTQTAYLQACDRAYMQVTTGTLGYADAIRRAVRSAAEQGAFVLYPSGHRDRLDVAVRRSVLTGVGQTVRKISEINAHDMDCDLMEITAHGGARPSHAVWQGKLVSLSGKNAGRMIQGIRVLTLRQIGYGSGDGFGGWNCRHDWFPFFEDASRRAYTDERLQELNRPHIDLGDGHLYTDYEVTQMQRALEREIRKCKRWMKGAAAGVDSAPTEAAEKAMKAELTDASVALKQAEQKLKDFCDQTGFLPDDTRVWVNGFGRSEAQRAVWENKKLLQLLDQSDIMNVGKIIDGYKKYIQKYPDSSIEYYMIDYKLKQAGIKRAGVPLPPKTKQAVILPNFANKSDPYHIMHRMAERNISDDNLREFMNNSKVMFAQWNGQRRAFYSDAGAVVINNTGNEWIYITAFSKHEYDPDTEKIMEVIHRYVG